MNNGKIKSFTDLVVWQEGHGMVIDVYKTTESFPKAELYGLSSQMRRSSASVTANIAEGFGRQGFREKVQFYYMAQGSLTELKDQLLIAKDVGHINNDDYKRLEAKTNGVHRLLQGLITKSKTFISPKS